MKIVISRSQKIALVLFLALCPITATIYIIGYHDFIPNPAIFKPALAIAATVTVAMLFIARFIKPQNCSSQSKANSLKNKISQYLFVPLGLYIFLLMNTYWVAPRVYTVIFGTETTAMDKIKDKSENHGRSKICKYNIKLESYSALSFEICISKNTYYSTLDSGGTVELKILKSPAGSIIQSVNVPN